MGRSSIAVICALAASAVTAAPAAAAPALTAVDVIGDPVEGGTLTASYEAIEVGPNTTAAYEWLRCDAEEPTCTPVDGAATDAYALTALDVGSRIAVTVTLRNKSGNEQDSGTSEPTGVVLAAPEPPPEPEPEPEPDPEPTPTPAPDPDPTPGPDPTPTPDPVTAPPAAPGDGGFVQEGVTPTGDAAAPPESDLPTSLRYMRPFPVVRISGELRRGGARVTLLRVEAGRRARVRLTCRGRGCPVERLRRGPGRLTVFHRFLPANTRITIRVTRPDRIGKHVRLRIRAGRPPARIDACVVPGTPGPSACPAP